MERLDKILASQGTRSRKEVRLLLRSGRVTLDGAIVCEGAVKVDPQRQTICVDGQAMAYQKYLYLMLNKPAGVISAAQDLKTKTVVDLVPESLRRKGLFPVGRLDKDTEGLLLITDDGDYAHRVISPKKEVNKFYEAVLDGPVGEEEKRAFAQGIVFLDGTRCLPAGLEVLKEGPQPLVQICIREGKFHQVKKMAKAVGREVLKLKRVQIGALMLDEKLPAGACRDLTESERQLVFQNSKRR